MNRSVVNLIMRLRALIMIEFLDNYWSHQINSIKMIHRQIKMCEWFEHVLYRRTDHMTSFEYNSSRMIIIFATVLLLIHGSRTLSIMGSHTSWHLHSLLFSRSTSTATRRRDAATIVVNLIRSCSQFCRAVKFVSFSLFELFDWIEINLCKRSVFSRRRRDVCQATT
jgi:hypothetical protein